MMCGPSTAGRMALHQPSSGYSPVVPCNAAAVATGLSQQYYIHCSQCRQWQGIRQVCNRVGEKLHLDTMFPMLRALDSWCETTAPELTTVLQHTRSLTD